MIAIGVTALLTRFAYIGDPAITIDEQFYLLVGDRLWHGALPYVDIWDRKPIGLFLLFAGLRRLSVDGIVGYQIGALAFAMATACVIARIASRFARAPAPTLAGMLYLIYLPIMGGAGGQSPVFYNLPMACAGLLIVKAGEAGGRRARYAGLAAMALVGLAMQIKYTACIEGIGFGLYLTWQAWRADRRVAQSIGYAGLLILCALAPTLVAMGVYAILGHGLAFITANFVSIFQVHEPAGFSSTPFLVASALKMAPLLACSLVALAVAMRRPSLQPPLAFVCLWSAVAFAGFFLLGHYYSHYALPMLVPLALLNAVILTAPWGAGLAIGLCASLLVGRVTTEMTDRTEHRARIARIAADLAPWAQRGCIYLNEGPPILYLLTNACLPSPYVFPEHLNRAAEADATNAIASMAALIARRPSAIVLLDRAPGYPRNRETAAMLDQAVAKDYHRVASVPDLYEDRQQQIFVRNDVTAPAAMTAPRRYADWIETRRVAPTAARNPDGPERPGHRHRDRP